MGTCAMTVVRASCAQCALLHKPTMRSWLDRLETAAETLASKAESSIIEQSFKGKSMRKRQPCSRLFNTQCNHPRSIQCHKLKLSMCSLHQNNPMCPVSHSSMHEWFEHLNLFNCNQMKFCNSIDLYWEKDSFSNPFAATRALENVLVWLVVDSCQDMLRDSFDGKPKLSRASLLLLVRDFDEGFHWMLARLVEQDDFLPRMGNDYFWFNPIKSIIMVTTNGCIGATKPTVWWSIRVLVQETKSLLVPSVRKHSEHTVSLKVARYVPKQARKESLGEFWHSMRISIMPCVN